MNDRRPTFKRASAWWTSCLLLLSSAMSGPSLVADEFGASWIPADRVESVTIPMARSVRTFDRGSLNDFDRLGSQAPRRSDHRLRSVARSAPQQTWRPARRNVEGYRLPGEFEPQRGLLLPCSLMLQEMPDLFASIVAATREHTQIVAMVVDLTDIDAARSLLAKYQVFSDIHFLPIAHGTMWSRDYGPFIVADRDGNPSALDSRYASDRFDDDEVPVNVARQFNVPLLHNALLLEGGNLLSNGQGVCVSTTTLVDANLDVFTHEGIENQLRYFCGARDIVWLEPLAGEGTGHVDMFATFVSADTVVVGAYDPAVDPVNAAILNRNAARLAQVATKNGRLRVVRVPMPPNGDGVWRTHTNVIYANKVVVVPIYPGESDDSSRQALLTYQRLLPKWRVTGIDSRDISTLGGALHCVSMNLGPLAKILEPVHAPAPVADHMRP